MLSLNFFEIETNKTEISVNSTHYDGNYQKLRNFREDYPHLNFFLSHGKKGEKSKIYYWLKEDGEQKLPNGFQQEIINCQSKPDVWSKTIENSFIHLFESHNREIYKIRHSYTWNLVIQEDKEEIFNGIGFKTTPLLKFSFHFIKAPDSTKIKFGISVRKSFKNDFTLTEKELNQQRIDTRNWKRNNDNEIVPSLPNIKKLLEASNKYEAYLAFKNKVYTSSNEYLQLKKFHGKFCNIVGKLFLPDGLKITQIYFHKLPDSNFKSSIIDKPQYYFHNESKGGGYYNERIKKLKPSSFDAFRHREYKILFLTPSEYEGSAGSFSTKLIQTLKETFHLLVTQDIKAFNHKVKYAYSTLLKNLNVEGYDLVLQVVSEADKRRKIQESPYFVFKARMLNQKLPTQKILAKTIRRSNNQIIDAVALNIYSKLGGTAWTIEKDEKDKTEIIVGIGSTVDFRKGRIMGFANVLDYNGNYITGACTQISDLRSYKDTLQTHLIETITRVIQIKNIQKGQKFRLIFHLTKEAGKKHEIKAIENTLKYFSEYDIQFGIVHLSYGHNFRVYANEGKEFPYRGTFIQISENLALLHLGKPSKVPILVRRDKRSTYDDIFSMTKRVLYFAHLSQRSFRPSSKPVTILYPTIMAKLINELTQVPDWDKNMLNQLKDSLWFI